MAKIKRIEKIALENVRIVWPNGKIALENVRIVWPNFTGLANKYNVEVS